MVWPTTEMRKSQKTGEHIDTSSDTPPYTYYTEDIQLYDIFDHEVEELQSKFLHQ